MHRIDRDETLDFILANICHLHHMRAHQIFQAVGLHRGQPPVLMTLWEQEGLTQTDLAQRMRITPATLTKMLQRMEKAGFIHRKPDAVDQRITRVYLTESGNAIHGRVVAMLGELEAETFAGLERNELETLREMLIKLYLNLLHVTGEELGRNLTDKKAHGKA
jgi:DNA-binding MarR family transcriptional regulator